MLKVKVRGDEIRIGKHFGVRFQRTLRIPDDGRTYPLPPGLGAFRIHKVDDYADRVPEDWRAHGGVFIPMYQREALWLNFDAPYWHPCAAMVAVGKVNAITGRVLRQRLTKRPQNYLVAPDQPWLDGINAGDGYIRQFVAMPLGMGYTVEGQITGKEEFGGIQIIAYAAKQDRFPDEPPLDRTKKFGVCYSLMSAPAMGLGAGGRMKQKIYPDDYGIDTWDRENYGRVYVHIVNSLMYREITGEEPPATPISARTYTEYGLPWFDLYDEQKGDVAAPDTLADIKSVKQMDQEKGVGAQQDDSNVEVPEGEVVILGEDADQVRDGEW